MEPDSKLTSLHDQRDVTDVISRAARFESLPNAESSFAIHI